MSNFQKNSKDYGEPDITYQLAGSAEQRPLGIPMGDDCSARTTTAFKPPRFQESAMKLEDSISDFRKILSLATKTTSDFRNPAPLMQNYMIKSVKMTKKSILRDQFSWKVRNFAQNLCENGLHLGKEQALCTRFAPSLSHAFSQRHHFILLNFSDEPRPLTRFYEQNQISIGAAHHSADSTIADLGPSRACRRIWDRVCAFFMPIPIVLPPTRL